MLDRIKNLLGYRDTLTKRNNDLKKYYEAYQLIGNETVKSIDAVKRVTERISAKYGKHELSAEMLEQIADAEKMLQTSTFSEEEAIANGIDSNSVWMTERLKTLKLIMKIEQDILQTEKNLEEALKKREEIMKWPTSLNTDIARLDEWCDHIDNDINALRKSFDGRNDMLEHLNKAKADLDALRAETVKWKNTAAELATTALNMNILESTNYKEMAEKMNAHRDFVREEMKRHEKITAGLSKLKNLADSEKGLIQDKAKMTDLTEQLKKMVATRKMFQHATWRCQQALAHCEAIKLTGDTLKDHEIVKRANIELKNAITAADFV